MAKQVTISNVGECDLVFPSGDLVATGKSAPITSDDLDHPVVKAWLAEGKVKKGEIVVEEQAPAPTDAAAVRKAAADAAAAQKAAEEAAAAKGK